MYVDAEYMRESNKDVDPQKAFQELVKRVSFQIEEAVKYTLGECKDVQQGIETVIDLYVLDASTASKESKHVLFKVFLLHKNEAGKILKKVPAMFKDNSQCQQLAIRVEHDVVQDLGLLHGEKEQREPSNLVVVAERDGKKERICFIDMSVYSRNRNWRMAYCTKANQNRPFIPMKECEDGRSLMRTLPWISFTLQQIL